MASEQAIALYRKLNASGTAITTSNWREWERMASAAMKMPDFTPSGQLDSLHDLANEVGIEIQALKSRASRPGAKDTMARTAEEYAEDIATTAEIVRGWAKQMFEDAVARRYRKVRDTAQKIGQTMTRFDAELAKPIIASRPGAKARFKVEDRFYFGKGRKERFADDVTYSIAAHVGHEPVGHRSVRSLEEAKAIAKQMLASTKANAKGKPVLVEVYPVVNYSPKDAIVTLRG